MMASNEEKIMEEQTTSQKRKLTAQVSYDDDMDFEGFSELDNLNPTDTAAVQQTPSQPPVQNQQPASIPSSISASNPMQNGQVFFLIEKVRK